MKSVKHSSIFFFGLVTILALLGSKITSRIIEVSCPEIWLQVKIELS